MKKKGGKSLGDKQSVRFSSQGEEEKAKKKKASMWGFLLSFHP